MLLQIILDICVSKCLPMVLLKKFWQMELLNPKSFKILIHVTELSSTDAAHHRGQLVLRVTLQSAYLESKHLAIEKAVDRPSLSARVPSPAPDIHPQIPVGCSDGIPHPCGRQTMFVPPSFSPGLLGACGDWWVNGTSPLQIKKFKQKNVSLLAHAPPSTQRHTSAWFQQASCHSASFGPGT